METELDKRPGSFNTSDVLRNAAQRKVSVPDFQRKKNNVSGEIIFYHEDVFNDQTGVKFKIKIHTNNEDAAFSKALAKKQELILMINKITSRICPTELKYLNITKGSIDFDGFSSGMGNYFNIKQFVEDLLNIVPEIRDALVNWFEYIVHDVPITQETSGTTAGVIAGGVVAVAAATVGAPIAIIAVGGIAAYKFFKNIFS